MMFSLLTHWIYGQTHRLNRLLKQQKFTLKVLFLQEVLVMKKVTRALMIAFIIASLQGCAALMIACEIIDDTRGSECEF